MKMRCLPDSFLLEIIILSNHSISKINVKNSPLPVYRKLTEEKITFKAHEKFSNRSLNPYGSRR